MSNHSGHHRLTDSPARGRALLSLLRAASPVEPSLIAPRLDPKWRICLNCQQSVTSVYVGHLVCIRCHRMAA